MQGALLQWGDLFLFCSYSCTQFFSHFQFSFSSPFILFILIWHVPALFSSHLRPSLKPLRPACHTLITIYFPLRVIRQSFFFFSTVLYSWTFETSHLARSLEALTSRNKDFLLGMEKDSPHLGLHEKNNYF